MSQLEVTSLGEIPETQVDGPIAKPRHGGTEHLHEAPAGRRLEAHLDREPDVLLVDTDRGPEDELHVLGVHELEPRDAHDLVEPAPEDLLCGPVHPQHASFSVDHHHRVGLVGEQPGQEGFVDGHLLFVGRTEGLLEQCRPTERPPPRSEAWWGVVPSPPGSGS